MSNIHSNLSSAAVVAKDAKAYVGTDVKTWTAVFALSSLTLMVLQPSGVIASAIAVSLMMTMALVAHNSVGHFDHNADFDAKQRWISLLAPAQFACLIWIAVHVGRVVVGTTLGTSSLAAFIALALIVLIDALLSVAFLLTVERKQGVSGASVAALISSKYAGLLGKIA
jgi:ABC-type methionine transport system permease subunit